MLRPRSNCYTQLGRRALIDICLTCRLWKEAIYGSPGFWTSYSLAVDDIEQFNERVDFFNRWFSRAGELKFSLLVAELEEVEYQDDVDVETDPLAVAPFKPAYELFLKYSGKWERISFEKVRLSWMHGLFLFLKERDALEECFREVVHFCARPRGATTTILSLWETCLSSTALECRDREVSIGLFAPISEHLKTIAECTNLRKLVIRGDCIYWYWNDGQVLNPQLLLQETQNPPIVLAKLQELVFYGVVYTGAFLDSFQLPSLTTLGLTKHHVRSMAEWFTAHDIAALLKRSKCNLEHLILRDIATTNEDLVDLLKGIPSLKRLWLEGGEHVDCRFLAELRDDLPNLQTLQLTFFHENAHGPVCSRFVKDGRLWPSPHSITQEVLVKHGLAGAPSAKDHKPTRMARLENTFLQIKESDIGGDEEAEDSVFCLYTRGFDKLDFAEVRENLQYTDKPFCSAGLASAVKPAACRMGRRRAEGSGKSSTYLSRADLVNDNAEAFTNAYFDFASIRVYE
ncbi:hypothetical protein NMY22_g12092 [Coprinellus aureogranulatus]|nr:hypothetical protein NMY22_g12092 [Coprinellus aureogranulatus]